MCRDAGQPEVWVAWKPPGEGAETRILELLPFVLGAFPIPPDVPIAALEALPGGSLLRAMGVPGTPADELESHVMALLRATAESLSQEGLDGAVASRGAYLRARDLRLDWAGALRPPAPPPPLEESRAALRQALAPENLAVLVLGGATLDDKPCSIH